MGASCSSASAVGLIDGVDLNDPNRFDDLLGELLQQRIARALGSTGSGPNASETEDGNAGEGARYSPTNASGPPKATFAKPHDATNGASTSPRPTQAVKKPAAQSSDAQKRLQHQQKLLTSVLNQLEGKVGLALEKARRAADAASATASLKSPPSATAPTPAAPKDTWSASSHEGTAKKNNKGIAGRRTSSASSTDSSSSQNITSDKHEANNNSGGQQHLRFANRFQANKAFLDQLKLNAVSVSPKPEGATAGQHFIFAGRRAESKTGSAAGDFVVANTFQPYVGGGLGNNANFNISRENDEEVGPFSIDPSMLLDSTNFAPTNNSSQVVTSPVSKVGGGVGAAVQVPTGGLPLPVVSVSGERQDTGVSSNATPRAKKEQLSPRGLKNGASSISPNYPGAIPSETLSPASSPLGAPNRRLQQQTSLPVLGATTDNPSGADWLGLSGMKDSSQLASGSLAMYKSIRKQQQQQQELTQSFIAKSSPEASRLGIHQELHQEAEGGAPRSPGARNHTLSPADGPLQLRPPNPMARISITSDNAPTIGGARPAHTTPAADSVAEGGMPKVLESGELRPPQSPMGNASSATTRSERRRGTSHSKHSSGPSQQSSTVVLSFSKSELMIILGALKLLNNKK